MSEKLIKHDNGQWVLTKAVRKPSYGSIEVHEGIQREDAPLREKKYQGGDPKHQDRASIKTKAGNEKEYSMPDAKGKPKGITGGASDLNREKLIEKPYEEHERKAFKERQAKKSEEVVKFEKNGQWSLTKKVREEDWSSRHTDPTINPALGGKYGKIHGGDPRKPDNKVNADQVIENVSGKPKKRVSGASNLRVKYDTKQESGESQSD